MQKPPTLIIYDLSNDRILRNYTIPENQRTADSLFANIAVEDESCTDSYGYLADLGGPGIIVYSWRHDRSSLVKNKFFQPDPEVNFSKKKWEGGWGEGNSYIESLNMFVNIFGKKKKFISRDSNPFAIILTFVI